MGKDVIIALDFDSREKTLAFLDRFREEKPFVKIGMELYYADGPAIVRATGNTAGPESPPVPLASTGFFVFRSIRMASRVLMRLTPSAPASSQARAMAAMSVTLGLSFMKTGFLATLEPRFGNPTPRIAEAPQGMLNAVGLQDRPCRSACRRISSYRCIPCRPRTRTPSAPRS